MALHPHAALSSGKVALQSGDANYVILYLPDVFLLAIETSEFVAFPLPSVMFMPHNLTPPYSLLKCKFESCSLMYEDEIILDSYPGCTDSLFKIWSILLL